MATAQAFQSLGTRIAIVLCFWAAIVFSIPSWLKLTTIQRLPLPTREIASLEDGKCPLTFEASLAVLVDANLVPESENFLAQVQQLVQQSLELNAHSSTARGLECTQWTVEVATSSGEDKGYHQFVPDKEQYAIRVASDSASQRHSHVPTVYLSASHETSLAVVPDTISAAVVAELLSLHGDQSSSDQGSILAHVEQDPRVIQYSKHIRLVFSIMNQDVTDTTAYDSRMVHALASQHATGPIGKLQDELRGMHHFHVETQVQWFAPLHFQPTMEVLEEIVEHEVDEEVLVDQVVEEHVEVEDEDEEQVQRTADEDADPRFADAVSEAADERASEQTDASEEAQVEVQLATAPAPRKRRTKLVKQARTIQVPQLQRVVKQKRTRLPPRYVVEWDDLQVFVNSEEWALTSTVPPSSPSSSASSHFGDGKRGFDQLAQTHDLHFLVYIPSRSYTPLLIRDPVTRGVKDDVNAWLIPQWGGVVILNVHHDGANASSAAMQVSTLESGGAAGVRTSELPVEEVQEAISLFARQLEILLGLGDSTVYSSDDPAELVGLRRKVRLQSLKHRRTLELVRSTLTTLRAITKLVNKILNLGVGPAVKNDTETALSILQPLLSQGLVQQGALDAVFSQVSEAHELSNRAFFNPDMLGLLYFPDEHKYAVYTPLFAPLLVPLVVTSIKLLKQVRAKRAKRGSERSKASRRKSTIVTVS